MLPLAAVLNPLARDDRTSRAGVILPTIAEPLCSFLPLLGPSPRRFCLSQSLTSPLLSSPFLAVGVEAEDARITQLLGELSGKDLNEVIAAGKKQLAAVPSGERHPMHLAAQSVDDSSFHKTLLRLVFVP